MRTESEIKQLPLEEQQKLVVELRLVKLGDKSYANAKAIIDLITGLKKWEEPELFEVKNIASHIVTVDGSSIAPDATAKVYHWQYQALARFLEPGEELQCEIDGAAEAAKKEAAKAKPQTTPELHTVVVEAIAKGFESLKGKAALLLFGLFLLVGSSAMAQNQSFLYGTFGQYNVQTIAGLNGGTNNFQGTNATFSLGVNVTNTSVSPTWLVSNGVTTVTFTTNIINITTNVPGLVSVVNYDSFGIQQSFQLGGAGTGTFLSIWDASVDNINWQTNALTIGTIAAGTSQVTTYTNIIQQQYGFIRLNTAYITATGTAGAVTNLYIELVKKSNRQGP